MKLIFVSNFFNHHQKPVSDAFFRMAESFFFIETEAMPEERRNMGYATVERPDYVLSYCDAAERARCEQALQAADVVLFGSAPQALFNRCVQSGKLIFRYSERPLKYGPEPLKYLPRLLRWHKNNPPGARIYLLCASAYTAGDYAKFGLFRGRAYRWGYFPETVRFRAPEEAISEKDPLKILWAGRLLELKHPDDALRAAIRLQEAGISFSMDFIGAGEMERPMREMIAGNKLEDRVLLLGAMPPNEVRSHMEKAGIFLMTSDRREGWGAVVNEAMNAGCAAVVSRETGAAPFLIEDGVNGLLFNAGDVPTLTDRVLRLLCSPEEQQKLGLAGYETVTSLWNAQTAAERFFVLSESLLQGSSGETLFLSGPCSPADVIDQR